MCIISIIGTIDQKRMSWPVPIVTAFMSYLTTGGSGKEHWTNRRPPTGKIQDVFSTLKVFCQSSDVVWLAFPWFSNKVEKFFTSLLSIWIVSFVKYLLGISLIFLLDYLPLKKSFVGVFIHSGYRPFVSYMFYKYLFTLH